MDKFHHYLLRLYNVHKKVNLKRFAEMGMSQGQPKVLELLLYNDGCSQKELAKLCELQAATMSTLLKKMEKDNLVHRVPETMPSGTRITRIFLTKHGREMTDRILECVDEVEERCFEGFTDKEKQECIAYMDKIYKNLDK